MMQQHDAHMARLLMKFGVGRGWGGRVVWDGRGGNEASKHRLVPDIVSLGFKTGTTHL